MIWTHVKVKPKILTDTYFARCTDVTFKMLDTACSTDDFDLFILYLAKTLKQTLYLQNVRGQDRSQL